MVVPIETMHSYSDKTCPIQVRDHEFITKPSCFAYRHVKLLSHAALGAELQSDALVLEQPISMDLVGRIQAGHIT